jgi:ribosome biogenesis GTPase / thiamine phosphate phosphatase
VLVLTKADLADEGWAEAARLARRLGVPEAVAVSATAGEGLGTLRQLLLPGETAALLGPSGAGKSTLVNALLGDERQATGAVRESDGRGRHTTVTRELIALPGGASVIDTPGLRQIALHEPGGAFAEIDELAAGCRFADCGHDSEPGCAVRAAVPPERIAAWRKLARADARAADPAAATRARKQFGRAIARANRQGPTR